MRQLINYPTRDTLTTSTIVDVIFSTEHESYVVTGVYDISLSDHYMTYTIYSKISHKTCLHKEINFRNYCTNVLILTPLGMFCRKTTIYVILAGQRINLLTRGISLKMVL